MKIKLFTLLIGVSIVALTGCEDSSNVVSKNTMPTATQSVTPQNRWYDQQQVMRGNLVFQANCAVCHKADASGTKKWQQVDANDQFPPPPLNGTAHTWHHPLAVLRRSVKLGGVPLGGTMPAFADKLNDQQINDTLAWIQSHWSDKIYGIWHERNIQATR